VAPSTGWHRLVSPTEVIDAWGCLALAGLAGRVPCAPGVLHRDRGTRHPARSQLPPSCPTTGARKAPPDLCGSQLSFDGCLVSASSSSQQAVACRRLETTPVSVTSPGCSAAAATGGHLALPASCLAAWTTGTWAAPGRDEEEKEEGCQLGGGWCPSCHGDTQRGQPCLWHLCRPSLCRGHSAEMSQPTPSLSSAAACVTILLSCAWLCSATQLSPSKCLVGSGG